MFGSSAIIVSPVSDMGTALETEILRPSSDVQKDMRVPLGRVGYPNDVPLEMMLAMGAKGLEEGVFSAGESWIMDVAENLGTLLELETDAHTDSMHRRHVQVIESKKFLAHFEKLRWEDIVQRYCIGQASNFYSQTSRRSIKSLRECDPKVAERVQNALRIFRYVVYLTSWPQVGG